jgi:hypothetical protein
MFEGKPYDMYKNPFRPSSDEDYSSYEASTEYDHLTHSIFNNPHLTLLYYVYSQINIERAKDFSSPQSKVIDLLDKISFSPYTFTEKEVLITLCNELETKEDIRYGVLYWENIVNFYYRSLFDGHRLTTLKAYVFEEVSSRKTVNNVQEVLVPALQEVYDNDVNNLSSIIYNNPWLSALYIVAQALTVFFNSSE